MKEGLTIIIVERLDHHKTLQSPGRKLIGPRVQLQRASGEEWLGSRPQLVGGFDEVLLSRTWGVEVVHGLGPQVVLQGELAEVNWSFRFDLSFL